MGKVSFKALIRAVSYVLGVMALGGCIMEPVNLNEFVDDKKVQESFDKKVNISEDSDPGLTPSGNGEISGLDPNKYYTVEEWDEEGKFKGIQFVSPSGRREPKLNGIGRAAAGKITGLANTYHYRVLSAKPLTGSVSYDYVLRGVSQTRTPADGVVTAYPFPTETGDYLIFTPTLPPPAPITNYDIARVPVYPAGSAEIQPNGNRLMMTAFPKTVTDYVFYDRNIRALYVLRISCDDGGIGLPPDTITITVTPGFSTDGSPTVTPIAPSPQIDTGSRNIIFTVSNPNQYDDFQTTGIKWYYNNSQIGTGASFTLNITPNSDYNIIGKHKITVEAAIGGVPYSTEIEFEVTLPS